MKTEKAEFLNAFIDSAISAFNEYQNRSKNSMPIPEEEKQKYGSEAFKTHFNNFTDELKDNIRTYRDIYVVRDYIVTFLQNTNTNTKFHKDQNKWIIETGYEVEFLIKFKKDIEYYVREISSCSITNDQDQSRITLKDYYDDEMRPKKPEVHNASENREAKYIPEKRFDFNELKTECDSLKSAVEKLKLINERLFDFEQWQLQQDWAFFSNSRTQFESKTHVYYPKFKDLCGSEIRRIEKLMEVEQRTNTPAPQGYELITFPYKWQATDTDFLELFAALHQNQSIVRTDGKPLTRKELLEYFQSMLGLQIKDAEGKLNRAGNRNENTAFLDTLAQQFRNYVATKEEKANSRK